MTIHLLATSALALAQSVSTQPPPGDPLPPQREVDVDVRPDPDAPSEPDLDARERIVITGHVIEGLDLLAGATVVEGEELVRNVETQIGDTLARQPGVSATSFAPGSSRPVLRGFSGTRVRVLNDGIGSIDVSNTSVDHAVTIDPLTVERVEVLRGPAVLIFGGQAIGGAVNVIDRRIPRTVGAEDFHLDALAQVRSADEGVALGAAVDVNLTDRIVLHADASWNRAQEVDTGNRILSRELRRELEGEIAEERELGDLEEVEELTEFVGLEGELPNSQSEQVSAALGAGYLGDRLEIGASYTLFDTDYGIPARPGAGHAHGEEEEGEGGEGEEEEGPVTIDLRQHRFDTRIQYALDGFFQDVTLRAAYADYTHTEFEGDEVGTVFNSNGFEGRLQLKQADRDGWHGALGAQFYTRDFEAIGPEAFLPPNTSTSLGLFAVEEYQPNSLGIEGALRVDFTDHETDLLGLQRDFTTVSGAAGVNYELTPDLVVGANASYTERAPSPEELFSDGPHLATQAYERGDPDLTTESSIGGELFARYEGRNWALAATLFANGFDDFIYAQDTGAEEDELPLFVYRQQGADFVGFEIEGSAFLYRDGDFTLSSDLVADGVRATLDDGSPVPRIPPLRVLTGLEAEQGDVAVRAEIEYVTEQDRVAAFETRTSGFAMVNTSIRWRPWGEDNETLFLLQANNLFDVEARRHASFTKDFAPLAGRDVRATARFSF
ncbi:TonB-dependent receptor [Sphingomicrobium sp. XHP0239]|uniref:TonB-dependent receptor n=1 Tax=Sphingomicrobium maritimum TaxID=3133972 RepID=UPI0031CC492E